VVDSALIFSAEAFVFLQLNISSAAVNFFDCPTVVWDALSGDFYIHIHTQNIPPLICTFYCTVMAQNLI
jgi:hypothetical protein